MSLLDQIGKLFPHDDNDYEIVRVGSMSTDRIKELLDSGGYLAKGRSRFVKDDTGGYILYHEHGSQRGRWLKYVWLLTNPHYGGRPDFFSSWYWYHVPQPKE